MARRVQPLQSGEAMLQMLLPRLPTQLLACRGGRGTGAPRCRGAARWQTGRPHTRPLAPQTGPHAARTRRHLPAEWRCREQRRGPRNPRACGMRPGWQPGGLDICLGKGSRTDVCSRAASRGRTTAPPAAAINPSPGDRIAGLAPHLNRCPAATIAGRCWNCTALLRTSISTSASAARRPPQPCGTSDHDKSLPRRNSKRILLCQMLCRRPGAAAAPAAPAAAAQIVPVDSFKQLLGCSMPGWPSACASRPSP